MSVLNIKSVLGVGQKVAGVVSAFGGDSEAVPEIAPVFTGGAAQAIGWTPNQANNPAQPSLQLPFQPFYMPPVSVDEDDLRQEAKIRAGFILSRLKFGSSIFRNMAGEFLVKNGDEQLVEHWNQTQASPPPAGSMVHKALKRLAVREKLKNYKSAVTADDGELVELLEDAMFLDLKDQAQRGTYRKMAYDQMLNKMFLTEFFGMFEAITEPLADLMKGGLSK
ncbi:MAG: hypothetical protein QM669_12390 [Siphonobacter sp.]